jgi:RNA polymerase sigma factor (sigma-70 family)
VPIRDIDPALIDAARSGDRAAVEALLAVCQPDLRRFARRTCSTAEDAEDAVQEAMWILYRRIGAVRALTALTGWLFRVVRPGGLGRARRYLAHGPAVQIDDEPAAACEPDVATGHDIADVIAGLEPLYRDVLVLRDVRGGSGADVSRQLGISPAATKSRLHRARAMLRERLRDYDGGNGNTR